MRGLRSGFIAVGAALLWSCAAQTPHALDYVVLGNANSDAEDVQRPSSPELLELEADDDREDRYPIYAESPERPESEADRGTGGAGCGTGLIGTQCERGLLEDEPSLEEQQLLGPDGRVFESGER